MFHPPRQKTQSGNILIYILGAIVLMGVLVILVKGSMQPGSGIDAENVEIQASRVQAYAAAMERAVNYILTSGNSEADIRFAHTGADAGYGTVGDTPKRQVFEQAGGGIEYLFRSAGAEHGQNAQQADRVNCLEFHWITSRPTAKLS